ncbi:uncharacterized protein BO72DRAFT_199663 [Aspergillus fijiensis CBS 313.89]|uniref:Mus7/MMS22 family-domain-containing protein n=1 Tax=Aspergillus fijiensis CBS 313.89 TaxID=1448319 RepID=A0A8G1RNA8_9EURO|nr:uncharacterized protein BO72DRAFT_199663 [Aspergillus fijiensis CBS 313.89]RAK74531.1 hypothetical protein BO72DRAFT_199663 [Aspergillus fijiensis CBS 313.89]
MESWRERGFVPDSDSEDGFDSQETLNSSRKDDERAIEGSAAAAAVVKDVATNTRVTGAEGRGTDLSQDVNGSDLIRSSTLDSSVEEGPTHNPPMYEPTATADHAYEEAPTEQPAEETTPRASGKLAELDKVLGDAPRSASSTPRAQKKADTWDDSSSEDELQFEYMRPRKPARVYTRVKSVSQPQPPEENYDSSTPSSPLSSLDSLRLDFDDEEDQEDNSADNDQTQYEEGASNGQTEREDLMELDMPGKDSPEQNSTEQDVMEKEFTEQVSTEKDTEEQWPTMQTLLEHSTTEQDLIELQSAPELPPLDIPEELLRELSQPARRSLRERKAIQLHPYMLEDVKYRNLMRARGVKPVRVAQQEINRPGAQESQNQDYVDQPEPMSDSLGAEFEYLPSSPLETRLPVEKRPIESSPERQHHQAPRAQSTNRLPGPTVKRRKVSKTANPQRTPRTQTQARLQVVIDNGSSPASQANKPIFEIPSPPRSEDDGPSDVEASTTFRFPRGFTPALNTPSTGPRAATTDRDVMDWSAPEIEGSMDDGHFEATASPLVREGSQALSEEEREETDGEKSDEDEAAMRRRYQRRIKGVLPASWLRLDQQKQKEVQLGSAQRNNERMSARTDEMKGVARRVLKHGGNARLPGSIDALRQLADSDSEDGQEDKDADDESISRPPAARQRYEHTSLYHDMDDDIPEDNRIDDMFPPVPRSTSGLKARKQGKKDTTVKKNGVSSSLVSKRSHIKRQARLTDRVYRTQKQEKRRAPALPKIGVLDAPDVVSRPRSEQPHFLRVAARKARTRQDKGRKSPSRKVFKFNSRADTEDANASLREWRSGNLRQTRLSHMQTKPFKQQTSREGHAKTQDRVGMKGGRPPVTTMASSLSSIHPSRDSGEHSVRVEENPLDTDSTIPPQRSNGDDVSRENGKTEQPSNRWIVRRNFAVTSFTRNGFRPALLEEAIPAGRPVSSVSFQRSLSQLNRDYRGKNLPRIRRENVVMDRFIASRSATPVSAEKSNGPATAQMLDKASVRPPIVQTRLQSRQGRKRPPRRLEVNTVQEQEPPLQETITISDSHWVAEEPQPSGCPVEALEGLKRTYTIDFNISPLVSGTFFHESTFIGSGEFCRSLNILTRNLDTDAGFFTLHFEDERHRWGAWNDAVSSGLGLAFDKIVEELDGSVEGPVQSLTRSVDKQGCMVYRSLIKYVTDTLSFIDPIDRTGFVRRAHSLVCKVNDTLATLVPTTEPEMDHLLTISSYNAVFVNLLFQIAGHELVERSVADEVMISLKLSSKQTIAVIASELGQSSIRKHLQDLESAEARERGIRSGRSSFQAYVIVRHVLRSNDSVKGYFEDLLAQAYTLADEGDLSKSKNVSQLEATWRNVFTSLPLNEFDVRGIAQIGSRFREQQDNWPVVKMLLRPALESYEATSVGQPVSYIIYCRALFHRCFHLINGWGWRDCKPVLDTLYDFFAKNTLYNLRQEENYKSPSFLNELDRNPSLHVQPGEPCFHILLKIIASGLNSLAKSYEKKKVRNFAWRLLPNHGRMYPKEKPIQQTDLDALRNHHDLLCTLYYAVPDGCRPRLETIRDLVHPASSHRETCNISLRSWDRLVRFKLSTDEETSGLEAFADWHCYFVTELLKQHAMARQEVEAQNTVANKFSDKLVEKTIAQNQRQIESLLKTALSNLQGAVKAAPTLEHAQKLVSKMPVKALLGLFNPQLSRVNIIVTESLMVILAYLEKCNASQAQAPGTAGPPVALDDDSQEYGDWTDIEAVCGEMTTTAAPEIEYVEQVFHPAVSRLVSNCFGEDHCPEDAILLSAVECWTSIARTLVQHGLRHWHSYLTPYNGDSWAALRSTMQTRKFTPFFLASCIAKDARCIVDCKVQILGMWMASLVERVALLKYQHRLTQALLNQEDADPVLQNLPFALNRKQGRYSLSLEDISQRRLSLISSLLSNMRSHLQDLEDAGAREYSSTKQEYAEAIQRMMSSMKANYQELGNGTQSVQGAYVDLVHRVVGFLQQHSRQICPIDPFFIDPASFPLPSTDPTYIVARLKSYEPKVSVESGAKTLVVLVQSVSERAAIDGQQDYLVNQLHSSMSETYESGSPDKPTLRSTMLQAVLPAYLETAFSSRAAWIVSRPIVHTIRLVFKELLFTFDSTDSACVGSVLNMVASVFGPSYRALQLPLFRNVNLLTDPAAAVTTASFLEMITSALPIVDYIDRGTIDHRAASDNILLQLRAFRQLALIALSLNPGENDGHNHLPAAVSPGGGNLTQYAAAFTSHPVAPTAPAFFPELRHNAARELQSYIYEHWSCHQGKYYFTRRGGHQPQEVEIAPAVAARLEQSPLLALRTAAQNFVDTLDKLGLIEDDDDE